MSDHNKQVKEYTIVHPIFPSGQYEKIENRLIFLDWFIPLIFLVLIFVVLKMFIYHPDEKRKDQ